MHCGRGRGPRRSSSLASRYPRRALNYLRKLQGQRRAARVKAKRKATMFAHAVEKTTQRTRQEKRPASLHASVITRGFIAARKMLLASSELWVELWPPLPSRISLAPKAQHSLPSLRQRPRIRKTNTRSSAESAIHFSYEFDSPQSLKRAISAWFAGIIELLGRCPRLLMTQRLRRYTDDPCIKERGGKHAMRAVPCCSVRCPQRIGLKGKLRWGSGHYSIAEKENSAERLATPG